MPMYSETADPRLMHSWLHFPEPSFARVVKGCGNPNPCLAPHSLSSSFLPLNMDILNSVFDTIMSQMYVLF
ncbi:hypothetical protein DL89DRAFT_183853 [Linderina pennispora]|uniref:Uncharacterized protein n=1 Tax=Linderina pennispora TaxID=61395 RepID=A0A1Y1W5H0_9FUNG|nr:uncharacterized protein DL89DRAFT_183853 [Linderina pennispora]ORX68780.1 hypothetical protein DL89DRAFT_183853 [Linderina pennispora]